MSSNLSFNVAAFDKASQTFIQVSARVEQFAEKLDRLDRKRVSITADVDTAKADAALDRMRAKADELSNSAKPMFAAIVAGLGAVGYLAPAAAAGLAAVPAAIAPLGLGVAALAAGLSGVGDGVKALSTAEAGLAQGGTQAQAAQRQLEDQMNALSPSARSLAESIHGQVVPGLHEIRDATQDTMLPRLQVSLERLITLSPEVSTGLAGTGKVIGDLTVRGAAMMTTGPWRNDFASIMASSNTSLTHFGTAGLFALDSVRSLTVAGLPLIERFSQATQRGAELANQFIQTKRATGELDQFMRQGGDTLAEFGHEALQVITAVTQLTLALGPLGGITLKIVGALAEFLGNLAAAHPLLTQFAAAGFLAYTAIAKLSPVVIGLVAAYSKVSGVIRTAAGALTVGRVAADGFAEGLGGSAAASERATATGGRFSGALGKIAASLPIIGIALTGVALAYDNARSSADRATTAIERGGAEAVKAVRDLQAADKDAESHSAGNWIGALSKALGLAQPSLQSTKASLDEVGKAHLAAAEATIKHEDAVKKYGPDSAEAKVAADALTAAVDREETAQRQAANATQTHTQALLAQQNTMLMQVDKDLAFRQSLLAVEGAQKTLSDAVAQHGVKSLEARDASLAYEQSLYQEIGALGENVRAQNSAKTASEQDRLAVLAQKDEIFRLVAAAGGAAPPALQQMAAGMSNADFTARGATVSVDNLGRRVVALPGGKTIVVAAETAGAQSAIDGFVARNDGRYITLTTRVVNPDGSTTVRSMKAQALGGIVEPMALGGIRPMRGNYAQVVAPNTPRLIGDRVSGKESFIPWDGSARSQGILAETAQGMGYQLARAGASMTKHYHLTVVQAGNSETDLREQFRRMELLG